MTATPADARERLRRLIFSEALERGEFTLASGQKASYYLDNRRLTLHPEGAFLVAGLLLDDLAANGPEVDCIGGPTLGADPIVGAVVTLSQLRGRPLPGFLVRKEPKGHGTGRVLEGQHREGWRALVVEDTVSTGGSLLKAIGHVEAAGIEVAAVACIVDRGMGGREALAKYPYRALFDAAELELES